MREIKFRAWDKVEKKWLSTDFESQDCFAVQNSKVVIAGACQAEGFLVEYDDWNSRNEDIIISQYTGIKDKNGKEIYEGDVVSVKGYLWNEETRKRDILGKEYVIGKVEFGCFESLPKSRYEQKVKMYGWISGGLPVSEEYTVIGNIYENPELLT